MAKGLFANLKGVDAFGKVRIFNVVSTILVLICSFIPLDDGGREG